MTTTKLFVGNITRGSSSDALQREFGQFGTVAECDIISDYGFVHFADSAEADAALAGMHGAIFNGQSLKVEKSTSYVRKKAGDGNMGAESCYVCGKTGHWAKNCPQVPEHERDKQSRRAEKSKRERYPPPPPPPRGGRGGYDYYDDYDDYPPRRRRPPPPGYYDDYDDYDYYPRRRLPPPRYYDRYDYDYPPPPRRLPPPPYYDRLDDPYPPPRRPRPSLYDDYPQASERAPIPAAAPNPVPPVYYDFAEDVVKEPSRPANDIEPLPAAVSNVLQSPSGQVSQDWFPSSNGAGAERYASSGAERYPAGGLDRYPTASTERFIETSAERFSTSDRYAPAARYPAPGPDREPVDYYNRRVQRPY